MTTQIRYSSDRVLAPDGHKIITADSGEQGVEVAEKNKPNLIFLTTEWEDFELKPFNIYAQLPPLHLSYS